MRTAGGAAWEKHQQLLGRLSALLDTARRDPESRPSATATTAKLVVGSIEQTICVEIASGRATQAERLLPDLSHLAVLQFFGRDDASEEMEPDDDGVSPSGAR